MLKKPNQGGHKKEFILFLKKRAESSSRMSFLLKSMVSSQVKNLGLGGGEEEKKDNGAAADPAAAAGMTREEYEEYQKQVVEEK